MRVIQPISRAFAAATASAPPDVVTSSPETAALLSTVNLAISQLPAAGVYTDNGGAIPAAPAPGSALLLPAAITGPVAIPTGYRYVEVASGSTVNLTGGDASTMIIGDSFNYFGGAGTVASGAGVAQIIDTGRSPTILVGSSCSATVAAGGTGASVSIADRGTAVVTLSSIGGIITTGSNSDLTLITTGNSQTISVSDGAVGRLTVTGANDKVFLGGGGAAPAGTVPASGITDLIQGYTGTYNYYGITDPNSRTVLSLGYLDRVGVSAGVSTIFGRSNDVVGTGAGQVEFVGGQGVSTVLGGAANTTVFATSSAVFDVGTAQANVFVGGTAASTINAGAGGGSFFGGTAGDQYNFGTGNAQTFVGLGGSDTLSGAEGSVAPVIFAVGAEKLTITVPSPPVTVVSFAAGGVIDASATFGMNSFFAGFGSEGNQTLIGSNAGGGDTFIAGANPSATPTTITIDNWHSGDVFYLAGFTPADTTTMDTAISNSVAQGAFSNLVFTLADNTTISFVGQHPTNFYAPVGAAF